MAKKTLVLLALTLVTTGCSVLTGFGKYFADDTIDAGLGMDAGDRIDSGPRPDTGPLPDTGPRPDAGDSEDAGPSPCDPVCGDGESCVDGTCQCGLGARCAASESCCDGSCITLDTLSDCDACGEVCGPFPNSVPDCSAGFCAITCVAGTADCDSDISTGCEASLSAPETCGFCSMACVADDVCNAGACVSDCSAGLTECYGTCVDVGSACSCVAGAATGTLVCDDTLAAARCNYPTEQCNGLDDDCDGDVDEDFLCSPGVTGTCRVVNPGCTAMGTQVCNADCTPGACVVVEACNRLDDDCDGNIDEGVLTAGATVSQTVPMFDVHMARNRINDEIGAVYGSAPVGSGTARLSFARLSATGALLGGPVVITTSGARDWDIAFDGTYFVVAYRASNLRMVKLDSTDSPGLEFGVSGTGGAESVELALGAVMSSNVALAYIRGSTADLDVYDTSGGLGSFTLVANYTLGDGTTIGRSPQVLGIEDGASGGAFISWGTDAGVENRFLPPSLGMLGMMADIPFTGGSTLVETAWDRGSNTLAVVHGNATSWQLACIGVSSGTPLPTQALSGGARRFVSAADDGTFGVLTVGGVVSLERWTTTPDLFDTITISANPSGIIDLPNPGSVRYLTLGGMVATDTFAQPIVCAP